MYLKQYYPDVRFACGQGLWQLLIRDYASVFFSVQRVRFSHGSCWVASDF